MSVSALAPSASDTQHHEIESPLLGIDPTEFSRCFDRRPFLIEHQLCDHPLFDLERLLQLARELPERLIEYNAGTIPVNQDQAKTPRNGLSVEETIHRIRECKSWMVLKQVENDPAYKALLEECLQEVRPFSEPITPGMCQPHAYIFLTSPRSVTPYHIDPEHNFLLQIRGNKIIRQFDGLDPTILTHEELEAFYGLRQRNMTLKEENRDRCWTYNLRSGQGLHFPVTFPHWVENGDDVSISFSITFRTPDLDRRRAVYQVNHRLRKLGLRPLPYGQSMMSDRWKHQAVRVWSKVSNLWSRD